MYKVVDEDFNVLYENSNSVLVHQELERYLNEGVDVYLAEPKTYNFDTRIRPFDGVEVHTETGIPADEYVVIDSIKDTL